MLASSYLDKNEKKISLCYITVFIRFTDWSDINHLLSLQQTYGD